MASQLDLQSFSSEYCMSLPATPTQLKTDMNSMASQPDFQSFSNESCMSLPGTLTQLKTDSVISVRAIRPGSLPLIPTHASTSVGEEEQSSKCSFSEVST